MSPPIIQHKKVQNQTSQWPHFIRKFLNWTPLRPLNIHFYANDQPQGSPLYRVDSHLNQLKHLWSPMGWSRAFDLDQPGQKLWRADDWLKAGEEVAPRICLKRQTDTQWSNCSVNSSAGRTTSHLLQLHVQNVLGQNLTDKHGPPLDADKKKLLVQDGNYKRKTLSAWLLYELYCRCCIWHPSHPTSHKKNTKSLLA